MGSRQGEEAHQARPEPRRLQPQHRLAVWQPVQRLYIDPEQAEQNVWEATRKLNNESPPSVALGFNFNPDLVKTELANVAAVVKELQDPLTAGMVDPETVLPEYLKRLDEAGLQTIIAEAQKQLNEWAKTK